MSTQLGGLFGQAAAPTSAQVQANNSASTWQMLTGIIQAAQMIPQNQRAKPGSIAFTLVSGFLGSGKTTLINRLLAEPHGRRLAVLVNDFGAINIDAALVRSRDSETISLANGCACCTLAGGLTRALIDLAQLQNPPESILLEASGVAEPHGILQVALANPALRLDGVLTLVDAETIQRQMQDPSLRSTIERQLGAADVLVLNKIDLVSASERAQLRVWLDAQVRGARVIETVRAQLPAEVALGIGGVRLELSEPLEAFPAGHDTAPFHSWSMVSDSLLDARKVECIAQTLPTAVIRAKGILCLDKDPEHYYVLQVVGRRWSLEQGDRREPTATRSELVLIGLAGKVDTAALRHSFEDCRVARRRA
jgi:G3E family GTPase